MSKTPSDTCVTRSTSAAGKTGKTEKTDETGNHEFLSTVFGNDAADARPIVVSFSGNPAKAAGGKWTGRPWSESCPDSEHLSANTNNYFSLAAFVPDNQGRFRRQKRLFRALHAVMLDDVGTKVDLERVTLKPSWLLETSPGNYQAGYLLDEPLTDGNAAEQLVNAIVEAHLCDPGAKGPQTRLARLPQGVNGKHSPPFQCRMAEWSPGLRYSAEEILDGLQLEPLTRGKLDRKSSTISQKRNVDGEDVWVPRPSENAVLEGLRAQGLYKAPLGDGKHDITCPWVTEHTDKADGGTAYFEPDDNWPIGGFSCLHGHCADRSVRDLLDFLSIEVSAARMKPTIRIIPGDIHRVVDAAERELAHMGRHFQRGGLVVTVITDPGTRETRVQEISQPALLRALAGAATWERYNEKAGEWLRTDPPARHVTVLHDSSSYRYLPVLRNLTRQPYLRPDGSVMMAADFDESTGMYGTFNSKSFSIPELPTRGDAESALAVLNDLLSEFSFASDVDRAAALSAILTAAVRPSLPHAPMFHARAHMVGSGKSYLCELITAFATPQRGTPMTFPRDDEECRKLLLAELLRAPAVIEFDNLTGDLVAHKSLCTVLTSEHLSGRILGVSKTATVGTRALFLSSGNNVGPVQDMTRRCVTIHLAPECEIPAARTFKRPDLVREVLAKRGRYVSAAFTIVRAWIEADKPKTACRSVAGFADWSDFCRQPLLWLGLPDPASSVFEAMAEDPDRETLHRLLIAWEAVFQNRPAMVRDAVRQAPLAVNDHAELNEVLHDIAGERGEINRRKLGWWIKRHSGRIVDGRRFRRGGGNGSAESWRVEQVSPVLPVSDRPGGK